MTQQELDQFACELRAWLVSRNVKIAGSNGAFAFVVPARLVDRLDIRGQRVDELYTEVGQ